MLTFLFWNLSGKRLTDSLARLVTRHSVDVLMLAECRLQPYELLPALNPALPAEFHYVLASANSRIEIYGRFPGDLLTPVVTTTYFTVYRAVLPGRSDFLIAAVHLPSKLYQSNESQIFGAVELSRQIQAAEEIVGHRRTILVGDLNMNPFEVGMIAADGLHAMMTRQTAARMERTVQSRTAPFFYNPMWNHFGDANGTPSGTYYYPQSEQVSYFWHMFDQVLLRPDLLSAFQNNDLHILTTDGDTEFITGEGLPDKTRVSDHLPILFRLDL